MNRTRPEYTRLSVNINDECALGLAEEIARNGKSLVVTDSSGRPEATVKIKEP